MSYFTRPLSVLAAIGLAACASSSSEPMPAPSAAPAQAAAAAAAPAVGGGEAIISATQVTTGRNQFRSMCTECHTAAEFGDATFQLKWSRRSVGDLYEFILTAMPDDAPGILTPQQAVDLTAFMLEMNGFPTGSATLDPDQAELDAITLARIRSE
ncbi:MAG: cytochrome c [Gemmatimonadota bacterium]|nr:cytochrome c [Gemmatimonadota bacterium]MDH3424535.1 cytochrome c [Gemmatimonadota bacterium]